MTTLDAAKIHDIRELQRMLASTGMDNYTHAICQIALGDADEINFEGLTDAETAQLREKYENKELAYGWERDVAISDALDAAMTDKGLADQD